MSSALSRPFEAFFPQKSHICIESETLYLQGLYEFSQVQPADFTSKNVRQKLSSNCRQNCRQMKNWNPVTQWLQGFQRFVLLVRPVEPWNRCNAVISSASEKCKKWPNDGTMHIKEFKSFQLPERWPQLSSKIYRNGVTDCFTGASFFVLQIALSMLLYPNKVEEKDFKS